MLYEQGTLFSENLVSAFGELGSINILAFWLEHLGEITKFCPELFEGFL